MTSAPDNAEKKNDGADDLAEVPYVRWTTPEENKVKARKFFEHARKATEQRNFDYAIKLYTDGLALWPDAVDEGLRALWLAATARKLQGGKPAGFLESRRRSLSAKDSLRSLNNALYLFGLDPSSVAHLEQILQHATRARCDRVVAWAAPVLVQLIGAAKKLSESHYQADYRAMEEAAEIAARCSDDATAMSILQACISTAQIWASHYPDSAEAQRARSNATGKLTILKGRFDKAGGFTESLKDAQGQHDLRDRDRTVHSADRLNELIVRARQDWEANRDVPNRLLTLVDLMLKREIEDEEKQAVELLEKEFALSANYIFKQRADDVRIRQLSRRVRQVQARAEADPGNAELKRAAAEALSQQLHAEIAILLDRQKHYPTDLRVKFQLGVRLFRLRRYDEAIPLFQLSQADGRCRTEARLYMGRCFFEKGFHEQAVQTFRAGLEEADSATGPLAMELNYWLAKSLEADGHPADARRIYGQLIQLDYNYKDARQRLEALAAREKS